MIRVFDEEIAIRATKCRLLRDAAITALDISARCGCELWLCRKPVAVRIPRLREMRPVALHHVGELMIDLRRQSRRADAPEAGTVEAPEHVRDFGGVRRTDDFTPRRDTSELVFEARISGCCMPCELRDRSAPKQRVCCPLIDGRPVGRIHGRS